MGALRPPNPPSGERPAATTERRGAIFWCLPRHSAPYSFTTDERVGVWGLAPIIKLTQAIISCKRMGHRTSWHKPKIRSAALGGRGFGGETPIDIEIKNSLLI